MVRRYQRYRWYVYRLSARLNLASEKADVSEKLSILHNFAVQLYMIIVQIEKSAMHAWEEDLPVRGRKLFRSMRFTSMKVASQCLVISVVFKSKELSTFWSDALMLGFLSAKWQFMLRRH